MRIEDVIDLIKESSKNGLLVGRITLTDPKWIDINWRTFKKKIRITVNLET